jgi:hypothetical protein
MVHFSKFVVLFARLVGRLAPERLRRRYINRDVSGYFKHGAQNPISYVNIR